MNKYNYDNSPMYYRLREAIERRDEELVASLLFDKSNTRIGEVVNFGKVIFLAFKNTSEDLEVQVSIINIIKLLLKTGANVNVPCDAGRTVLYLAMTNRMTQVIDFLISSGADLDACDLAGNSVLHFLIKCEFERFKDNYRDTMGRIEKQAFENRSKDFIKWIVSKRRENVDCRNKREETPLHLAAKYNMLYIIPCLLRYTTYVQIFDYLGMTAFQIFVERAICGTDDSNYEDRIPIRNYDSATIEKLCKKFLAKGFSVDVTDIRNTPIHYALRHRKRTYAWLMLKHMRNVNARDESGNTALNLIMNYRYNTSIDEQMVRYLLSKGADCNIPNIRSSNPLIAAVVNKKLIMLKIFKDYRANFCRLYKAGNLLHYFFSTSLPDVETSLEIFNLLIDEGISVNETGINSVTPLHLACKYGNSKMVERLIELGAHVNAREWKRGYTPLHMAVAHNHCNILEILVRSGADIDAKPIKGGTLLYFDCTENVMKKLIELGARIDITVDANPKEYQHCHTIKDLLRFGADINDNSSAINVNDLDNIPKYVGEHLIRLTVLGLPIDKKLKCILKHGSSAEMYRKCLKEIEILKSYNITGSTSLYNFLLMSRNSTCMYIDNDNLKELISSSDFEKRFPTYHVIISSIYYMAIHRRKLLPLAKCGWLNLTNVKLPDVCIYEILTHLSNWNLTVLSKKLTNSE